MLGNLLVSPLLDFNSATCCSFASLDLSTSATDFALPKLNSLYGVRTNTENHVVQERASHLVRASRKWELYSVAEIQSSILLLEDDERNMWQASRQALSTFKFSTEETDMILSKAFGWVHSPYWGEEKTKMVPKKELINEVLDYLKNLGLSDDDLSKLLKKFPEVLGCSLTDELKSNVGTLEREWGIKGKSLRSLLLRNPKVLGYNVDCKGDCLAKCTCCWVRF